MGFLLKISGAGNRFLLADERWFKGLTAPINWTKDSQPTELKFEDFKTFSTLDLAKREKIIASLLSNPQLSQTDGLVILRSSDKEGLIFDFYNKDGSQAEMCGNATCCLAFYLNWLDLNVKEFFLGTQKISFDSKGAVLLKKPKNKAQSFTKPFPFYFIDTGVPHGVIPCDTLSFEKIYSYKTELPLNNSPIESLKDLREKAQALRFKNIPPYKEGMNVSFYQALSNDHIKAVTFERGVEDFTLACGTGALAVSLIHKYKNNFKGMLIKKDQNQKDSLKEEKTQSPLVKVEMPGGVLTVEIGEKLKLSSQVKKGF